MLQNTNIDVYLINRLRNIIISVITPSPSNRLCFTLMHLSSLVNLQEKWERWAAVSHNKHTPTHHTHNTHTHTPHTTHTQHTLSYTHTHHTHTPHTHRSTQTLTHTHTPTHTHTHTHTLDGPDGVCYSCFPVALTVFHMRTVWIRSSFCFNRALAAQNGEGGRWKQMSLLDYQLGPRDVWVKWIVMISRHHLH